MLKRHYSGPYLGIVERDGWEYVTRTNASAVVALIAVTNEGELVLVEQFRVPVDRRVIEIPAGLVGDQGDADEPIELAAKRELLEETGYEAGSMKLLMTLPSSAGLADEMISFLVARDLVRTGPGGGDDSEDITTHVIPLGEMDQWLTERIEDGLHVDPKIYSALHWLKSGACG